MALNELIDTIPVNIPYGETIKNKLMLDDKENEIVKLKSHLREIKIENENLEIKVKNLEEAQIKLTSIV